MWGTEDKVLVNDYMAVGKLQLKIAMDQSLSLNTDANVQLSLPPHTFFPLPPQLLIICSVFLQENQKTSA